MFSNWSQKVKLPIKILPELFPCRESGQMLPCLAGQLSVQGNSKTSRRQSKLHRESKQNVTLTHLTRPNSNTFQDVSLPQSYRIPIDTN